MRVEAAATAAATRARLGSVDEQFPELDTADNDTEMKAILGDRYADYVRLQTSMAADAMEAALAREASPSIPGSGWPPIRLAATRLTAWQDLHQPAGASVRHP